MIFKKVSRRFLLNLVGLASLAILAVGGCSKDESDSITNPGAKAWQPVGTIQGVVRDAVTLQPIVGALVSVDLKSDTTDEQGSYVIKDVPATQDGLSETVVGTYTMEVDLSNAYTHDELGDIDVDMRDEDATPRYPRITYGSVRVSYTSLNDSECSDSAESIADEIGSSEGGDVSFECGNSTNHDTPVDGLVASHNFQIGKLACNVRGFVYGCEDTAEFATIQPNYEVKLVNDDCEGGQEGSTGSGQCGNVVGLTTTSTTGEFEFANIECGGQSFEVVAANDFENPTSDASLGITGPFSDGETLTLDLEHEDDSSIPKDEALHVCINDDLGPQIISISPEPGSDLSPSSTGQVVSITFHEPIAQDPGTDTDPSGVDNLYDDIEVNFDGNKAGNQPFTLAWSNNDQTLTVTFEETGASSLYHVRLFDVSSLTDAAGNSASLGVCPDDAFGESFIESGGGSFTPDAGGNDCTIWFSTTGGSDPAAPTLDLANAASLDEGTAVTGIFDWNTSSGSKSYRLYCQKVQVWDSGLVTETSQIHPFLGNDDDSPDNDGMVLTGSAATVDFDTFEQLDGGTDGVAFVENNEIALHYNCYVVGVNSDGVEGSVSSNIETAEDSVGPLFIEDSPTATGAMNCSTGSVDASGNPVEIGADCDIPASEGGDDIATTIDAIVLAFNETIRETELEDPANYTLDATFGATSIVSAIGDVTNTMVALHLATSVSPTLLPSASVAGGPDGVVQSTTAVDDVRNRPTCVTEAAGGVASDEAEAGDDVDSTPGLGGGLISVGPDGVCDTTATTGSQTIPVLQGLPSQACVGPGTNAVLETAAGGNDVVVGQNINSGPAGAGGGICESTAVGDDVQLVTVGEGLNTTSISGGPNHVYQGVLTGDDILTSPTAVTAESGIVDVNNNSVRSTGDEFATDGVVK